MTTPAGWYDDPDDSNSRRYWDGQNWTSHRERKPISGPTPPPVVPAPMPPPGQQPQWSPPGQPPGAVAPRRSRAPLVILIAVAVVGVIVAAAVFFFVIAKKTVDAGSAEKAVVDTQSEHTGFTPTDVKCPSGVEAKVGVTFNCHFSTPDGPYTAYLKVTKVDGERVEFIITTQPSSDAPPS
jgi:hypothetical protein